MTAIQNLFIANESQFDVTENQDLIADSSSNAQWQQEVTMSNNENQNQTEQRYYNKASGCSVKAQKDNLFDYTFWAK